MNNPIPLSSISLSNFDEFAKNMIFKRLSLITKGSLVINRAECAGWQGKLRYLLYKP